MPHIKNPYLNLTLIILLLFIVACNNNNSTKNDINQLVQDPDDMNAKAGENIKKALEQVLSNNSKLDDTIRLNMAAVVNNFYNNNNFKPVWSNEEKWLPLADSLHNFINNAELEGLFPNDYHFKNLNKLQKLLTSDSLKRTDAVLWSKADLMFTDAFMRLIKDLKYGRLKADSISLNPDSVQASDFFVKELNALIETKQFTGLLNALQPTHKGYWELKNGIKRFLDSMDHHTYTYVTYPYKKGDIKDSVFFVKTLQRRLNESGAVSFTNGLPDSAELGDAIKKYQKQKGIKPDGKITTGLIKTLNISDAERFKRIAITLDRYKQLPAKLPQKYIWVNIPAYTLWVIENDTVVLESRVITGKPDTRTPVLNSEITDMITYPTWTVPTSIIAKQYLPKLKNNPGYLTRLGLRLVNGKGETINPYDVNWAKYSKGIPYKVMQGSGDDNALGVFKFNFNNPFAVYLHDTNQRYLFKNASRALSHGCVRVQEWEKLAFYIARNDSITAVSADTLKYTTDSIKNWIAAKERHRIEVKNKIPIYIRYFSCEAKEGKIKFYDDVYGEDKLLREKYFNGK
jgi:murein L,D-transpeptidase YcbB/YkuD